MASQSQFDLAVAGQLTEKIHSTLTEKECSIFNRGKCAITGGTDNFAVALTIT